jgi:4-hydroxy-tetrahydrodipicolinate synthase
VNIEAIKRALATVIVVTVTPFDAAGGVDYAAHKRIVERLIEGGIQVITPNGNASEYYSLTPDETRRVLDATLEAADGRAVVMNGVGGDAVSAGLAARQAHAAGAQAVMVHQVVHPFKSPEGWVAYHRQIAEAAPDIPLVPYIRDASVTGANMQALLDAVPTIAGAKYAVSDPQAFALIAAQAGLERITWICGLAEGWAPFFWPGGAAGFTSGLASIDPRLPLEMFQYLTAGDPAGVRRTWAQAHLLEAMRARRGNGANVSVLKEALMQLGLCDRRVRPPISTLPESERAEITAILQRWGVVAAVA